MKQMSWQMPEELCTFMEMTANRSHSLAWVKQIQFAYISREMGPPGERSFGELCEVIRDKKVGEMVRDIGVSREEINWLQFAKNKIAKLGKISGVEMEWQTLTKVYVLGRNELKKTRAVSWNPVGIMCEGEIEIPFISDDYIVKRLKVLESNFAGVWKGEIFGACTLMGKIATHLGVKLEMEPKLKIYFAKYDRWGHVKAVDLWNTVMGPKSPIDSVADCIMNERIFRPAEQPIDDMRLLSFKEIFQKD